jgi:hypothetical protein
LKILKNEKYVGDLVQKKTIPPDYLSHERRHNHGEEPLIVLKDHHAPIVSRRVWDAVHSEIQKRTRCISSSQAHSNRFLFSGKILCGQCRSPFVARMKKRSDGTSYRRWCCRNAVKYGATAHNGLGCDVGKLIPDDLAANMLLTAIQSLPLDRHEIILQVVKSIPDSHKAPSPKPDRIRRKLEAAIDAYLSDSITIDDLEAIKLQCRTDTDHQITENRTTPYEFSSDILSCGQPSEIFMRTILHSMTVYKGGHVELRLKDLPFIWHFQLYLDGCHVP